MRPLHLAPLTAALLAGGATAATWPTPELERLASQVAEEPRNPEYHLQLGQAWDRLGTKSDGRTMARAAYDSALRLAPGDFRARMLAGRADYLAGDFTAAQTQFAEAALIQPQDPSALLALGAASYQAGDLPLALLAGQRAHDLAPSRLEPLRLLTLAHAASGNPSATDESLRQLQQMDPVAARAVGTRAGALVRTAMSENPVQSPRTDETPTRTADQVSVDVAIVLSQNTRRTRTGMNLLDGLRAQFSYSNQRSRTSIGGQENGQRTITDAISTPALNYNLNIFNAGGQYYQVVARPTLTAYRGETSEFFIGRTSTIPISGVNVAQLERVDIGITLKVTPLEIDGDRIKVRIDATRSFASNEQAGSFAESLTLFRQNVAATAEVRFGESLVLSGLSESVNDSGNNRTPVVGRLPVVGSMFNERSSLERRDAALILLTPSPVVRVPAHYWARPDSVAKIARLWSDVIDPASNATDVTDRLAHTRLFTRALPGDSPLSWKDGGDLHSLESLLLPFNP